MQSRFKDFLSLGIVLLIKKRSHFRGLPLVIYFSFWHGIQLKLKLEVFLKLRDYEQEKDELLNHFQPTISIKMVVVVLLLELIIASKKWPFHSVKKSCFDKCNCSNQTVKKISAEERSVSFELQRANLESTSKRIAFCKTRLLQEKLARASFSYMNGLKNGLPQIQIFQFSCQK